MVPEVDEVIVGVDDVDVDVDAVVVRQSGLLPVVRPLSGEPRAVAVEVGVLDTDVVGGAREGVMPVAAC